MVRGAIRLKAILVLAVIASAGVSARAGFTPLGTSRRASQEPGHEQILEKTYGGNFVREGNGFTNGTVRVVRVEDSGAGGDAVWSQRITSARAVAAFSKARKQSVGVISGETGEFQPLFEARGKNFNIVGSTDQIEGETGEYRLARRQPFAKTASSFPGDNPGGQDQMMTYEVQGLEGSLDAGQRAFLLFWEDSLRRPRDADYNDLVVELRTAGEPVAIPLPAAAWTGLSGLAGVGLLTGWKRFRRWVR